MSGQAMPLCSICWESLGKYGGPVTLPCGHNGCLHCMAQLQRSKPECPLCRAAFPAAIPLVVNHELRELIALAAALGTVEQTDGWQAVAPQMKGGVEDGEAGVSLVPTAPPAHVSLSALLEGEGDLLSLEPPVWVPDSHASACTRCKLPFRSLRRARHHCRLCGGIFCAACSAARMLLPPKFQEGTPQRICTNCAALLHPLQPFLAGTVSRAVQPAIHDVTDASALRSWFNPPLATSLSAELYKAQNIVQQFAQVGALFPERAIPAAVLDGAAGFAVLSVVKAGCGWSVAAGTGLVVARKGEQGGWSPPSALGLYSLGWGLQIGGSLCDLLIVLRNQAAVKAFAGALHCGVSGSVSLAVGPVGRQADATMQVGMGGAAVCYSYSCSKGAFAGVSIEGSLLTTRNDVNLNFYGRPLTAKQLLTSNNVSPPVAAEALYAALDDLMARAGALTAERKQRLGSTQRDTASCRQGAILAAAGAATSAGMLTGSPSVAQRDSRAARWAALDAASSAPAAPQQGSGQGLYPAIEDPDIVTETESENEGDEEEGGFSGLFAE